MPLPQLTADDVERALSSAGEDDRFQRLCNALIWAYAGRSRAAVTAGFTEREKAKDLGIDAFVETAGEENGLGPLLASGLNLFQYKRRDAVAGRKRVISKLKAELTGELARVATRLGRPVASYTLFTNVHLSSDSPAPVTALQKAILKGSVPDKTVVRVIGAAGIVGMLNDLPHLRAAFFGAPRFETWEAAWSRLAQTKLTGAHVELVGRKEEMERLSRLIDDAAIRVILVYGPHDVGKDRLILEATRARQLDVLVTAESEAPDRQEMQEIGGAGREALLIAQDVALESLADLIPRVLAQPALKIVCSVPTGPKAVLPSYGFDERVQSFPLAPLSEEASRELLRKAGARFDFAMESWVVERAGGIPGILLAAASLSGELRDRLEDFWKAVGQAFQHRVRQELGEEAVEALSVFSVLTRVADVEINPLAEALAHDVAKTRAAIEDLVAAGLLLRRGAFYEVNPPTLAQWLAFQAVTGEPHRVERLVLLLQPAARIRVFRRLSELPEEPKLRKVWAELLDALFANRAALETCGWLLPVAAEAAPEATLAALRRMLEPLSVDSRKAIAGGSRTTLVRALDHLLLRRETSASAASLLLSLAEACNETGAGGAPELFVEFFIPLHPQVAASLTERASLLRQAMDGGSEEERVLALEAIRRALCCEGTMTMRRTTAFVPPDHPKATYGELRDYASELFSLLLAAGSRSDLPAKMVAAARKLVPEAAYRMAGVLADETVLGAFQQCLAWLRDEKSSIEPAEVVCWLEFTIEWWQSKKKPDASVEQCREILDQIANLGFFRQIQLWTGESRVDDWPQIQEHLTPLVRQAIEQPGLLSPEVLDWLVSSRPGYWFFILAGEEDKPRRLLPLVEAHGGEAERLFGSYCAGWGKVDAAGLAAYLEQIEQRNISAGAMLAAAAALPGDPRAWAVIKRLAKERLVDPDRIASVLHLGGWLGAVKPEEAAEVLEAIAGPQSENAPVVVQLLVFWLQSGHALEDKLREVAWSCLEAQPTKPPGPNNAWQHDQLAAALTETEPERGFRLLEELLRQEERGCWDILSPPSRRCFWRTLVKADRRRALGTFFASEHLPSVRDRKGLIDQEADREILHEIASRSREAAMHVCLALDFKQPGFWELALPIAANYSADDGIESRLDCAVLSFGWKGSAVPQYERRLAEVKRVLQDPATPPAAISWLRKLQTALKHDLKSEAVWEYDVDMVDLKRMIEDRSSPERLWAIGRILKHAKWEEVQKLLGPEDIEEALPLVDLPEKQKQALETALRYWLRRA
jgi:hypothetical protein